MKKLFISNKEVIERFDNIICIGYCNANALLYGIEPTFYNKGLYGWNYDLYEINKNTCIITGYRNFPSKKYCLNYYYSELEQEDNDCQVILMLNLSYEEKLNNIKKIRENYINKIIGG